MKRLTKEKRDQLILVGMVTVVAVVGLWLTLISSQRQSIEVLARKNREEAEKVTAGERVVKNGAHVRADAEAKSGQLKSIEDSMPTGDLYAWHIQFLKNFRKDYKNKIEIPHFSREVTGEVGLLPKFPYRAAMFSVRGSAYYHDLGRFIADLENQYPYFRIQNVELEPAGASSATATADAEKLAFRFDLVAPINPGS